MSKRCRLIFKYICIYLQSIQLFHIEFQYLFADFLEEIDTVRRHAQAEVPIGKNCNTPVLVHCGAGAGRTGVAVACDVLLTWLDNNMVRICWYLFLFLFFQRIF